MKENNKTKQLSITQVLNRKRVHSSEINNILDDVSTEDLAEVSIDDNSQKIKIAETSKKRTENSQKIDEKSNDIDESLDFLDDDQSSSKENQNSHENVDKIDDVFTQPLENDSPEVSRTRPQNKSASFKPIFTRDDDDDENEEILEAFIGEEKDRDKDADYRLELEYSDQSEIDEVEDDDKVI